MAFCSRQTRYLFWHIYPGSQNLKVQQIALRIGMVNVQLADTRHAESGAYHIIIANYMRLYNLCIIDT